MASLSTALTATSAVFSNHLTYQPGMAPRSANRAVLEAGGMKVLPKEEVETLADDGAGLVPAPADGVRPRGGVHGGGGPDRFIWDLTIITEYVGDVDYLRNREHDDGDSMMALLSASAPFRSLVICPNRRSNVVRFINGIINHQRHHQPHARWEEEAEPQVRALRRRQ